VTWRLGRGVGGPLAGLATLLLLALCRPLRPCYEPKDAPFAVAMVILIWAWSGWRRNIRSPAPRNLSSALAPAFDRLPGPRRAGLSTQWPVCVPLLLGIPHARTARSGASLCPCGLRGADAGPSCSDYLVMGLSGRVDYGPGRPFEADFTFSHFFEKTLRKHVRRRRWCRSRTCHGPISDLVFGMQLPEVLLRCWLPAASHHHVAVAPGRARADAQTSSSDADAGRRPCRWLSRW